MLDTRIGKTYNILDAEVAQSVEQRTENPCVSGSIPLLGTASEVAERNETNDRTPLCEREVRERLNGVKASTVNVPKWRNGRRDSLKNCWGATPVSVRIRPSAPKPDKLPGCVAVAQRTLDPLAQVRILARQPTKSRQKLTD